MVNYRLFSSNPMRPLCFIVQIKDMRTVRSHPIERQIDGAIESPQNPLRQRISVPRGRPSFSLHCIAFSRFQQRVPFLNHIFKLAHSFPPIYLAAFSGPIARR
jgi:hypothetical protein